MTQRSILAGKNPNVVIKAGGSVVVRGVESEQVHVQSNDHWGLKVEKRSQAEFARARAAIGDLVLFDLHFKKPGLQDRNDEIIEVQLGGDGEVLLPVSSNLKVYAGRDLAVQNIRGRVDSFAGWNLGLSAVARLGNASAGGAMDLDCETLLGEKVEYKAGGDIRFYVHDLSDVSVRVKDIGGYWEAQIGAGAKIIYFKCGGDLTLVTDQNVDALPPDFILGKIEKPTGGLK